MKEFDVKITVSIAPSVDENIFTDYIKFYKNIDFTREPVYSLINNSDLVITKAGTTTVECALIGTPFISIYKTHIINYYLLKPFVKVNSLCMVNILAGKSIVKELIQNDFNVINLLAECRKILTDTQYYYNISESLKLIGEILGMQNASENAAKVISSYLN
jgi:lipid-A-disaccharide synthase